MDPGNSKSSYDAAHGAVSPDVEKIGYLYALAASVTAGLIPIIGKVLVSETEPLMISALTFLISGIVLLPYKPDELPTKRSFPWMILTGLLGAGLAPALYLLGISNTSAVNAALLANAEVFLTGIIAYLFFKERLKRMQLLESILVMLGIIVVTTGLDFSEVRLLTGLTGNLLILASCLVWAIDNNLSRMTSQMFGPIFVTKFRNIFGGGLVLAFLLAISYSIAVRADTVPLIILYACDISLATLTFMEALVKIGAVRTLLVFSTTSIFGSIFAVIVLGESITIKQVIGGSLILLGVFLIQRSETR